MKTYLLIMIILIFAGCKNRQRDDKVAFVCNFTVPEMLSFELDSPITLADSIFDANASDSTKMIPLNRDAMCQLLKIEAKVYNKNIRNIYNDTIVYDSSFHDVIYFFIYGKLYLQPDVKSIVVWMVS